MAVINKILTLCTSSPDVALISTNNGTSWTEHSTDITHDTSAICSNGTVFCVTPYDSDIVFTTVDGDTINYGTLPWSGNWNNIAWNGLVFLALLNDTDIGATSADGITWEEQLLPAELTWKGLVYESGVFCAFGYGLDTLGDEIPLATTSPDGIDWTGFTQLDYYPPFGPPSSPTFTSTITRNHQVHTLLGGGGYLVLLNPYGEGGSVNFSTDAGVTWEQTDDLWNYAGIAQMAVMNGLDIVYSGSYSFNPLFPTYDRDRCYFGNLKKYNIENDTDFVDADYGTSSSIVATWGDPSNAVFSVTYTGTHYLVITRLGLLRSTDSLNWEAVEDDGITPYPGNRFGNINAGQRILTASLNISDVIPPVPRFWKNYVNSEERDS